MGKLAGDVINFLCNIKLVPCHINIFFQEIFWLNLKPMQSSFFFLHIWGNYIWSINYLLAAPHKLWYEEVITICQWPECCKLLILPPAPIYLSFYNNVQLSQYLPLYTSKKPMDQNWIEKESNTLVYIYIAWRITPKRVAQQCVTCLVSPVTYHLSPVTYHLTTCYESPSWFGHVAVWGFVIDRIKHSVSHKRKRKKWFLV